MGLYLILILYQAVTFLAIPLYFTYAIIRRFQKKPMIGSLAERFGFVPKSKEETIWIHAVSVGEALSVANLIEKLKREIPGSKFYLTCGTLGGREIATKSIKADYISFLPFDFLPSVLLAFSRIKPKSLIIVEGDFWPNLLMVAYFKNITTLAINARIREKTLPRYRKLAFILRPLLNTISFFFVQTKEDLERFKSFGIKQKKMFVLGDIKSFNVLEKQKGTKDFFQKPKDYKILLAGSTHPGELSYYLNLFKNLKPRFENLKLLIVPRHFHWKDDLKMNLGQSGFKFEIWDDKTLGADLQGVLESSDILAICKLGILFKLYNVCDIFFLGGTFVSIGGHNLLEGAVWSKPSIVGPHHQNCKAFADELEKNNALIKVNDQSQLEAATENILSNPILLEEMGKTARIVLEKEGRVLENEIYRLVSILKNGVALAKAAP